MLPRPRRLAAPLALAGTLGILLAAGSARAQVLVTPTVTTTGSVYNYSYSITNLTATNLAVIDLNGLPLVSGALSNFTFPTGYGITNPYDSGVGIESFYEGATASTTFTPGTTVSGFGFSSIFAPTAISFDTLDESGVMTTGTTLGPAGAPVPEASTLVSLGLGLLALTVVGVRRRRASAAH